MDDTRSFTKCPLCDGRIYDTSDPTLVYAVQQLDVPGFGQAHDFVDGMGGFFHEHCPPGLVGYQLRPRPDVPSA